MYTFSSFAFILVTYFLNFCVCNDLYSERVRKYDAESFKVNVGGNIPHFINFFAPWCGFCKRLKPVWDELAEKYNVDVPNQKIVIAKVDCTSETPLCSEENISGYPSLIFYDAGTNRGEKYKGKRDLADLEEFISISISGTQRKKIIPTVQISTDTFSTELTDETFHSTIDFGLHFVKFYAPWCGHCQKMAAAWEDLAQNSIEDKSVTISSVDCTKNKRSCQEFEIKGFPTLLWIVDGKKIEKYQGMRDLDGFKKYITEMKQAHKERLESEEGKIPESSGDSDLVVELVEANFDNAIENGFTFVKFYVPWCGHSKRLVPVWNELAVKFVSNPEVKIAKLDCIKNEKICEKYKIVGYPSLVLFRKGKHVKEYYGQRTLENLHSFLEEYLHHTEL